MKLTTRAILPLTLLLSSTSAFAQSGPWTVSETRGDVVIRTADGEQPARRGVRIAAGQQVVTGRSGNATIVRGREFVTVRPNTRITIAPPQRERGVVQIIQDFGSALFNIGRQPDPHFGVDTPYLAAVVKGTTFSITVSEEGASMQVTEGAVEASTNDGGARDLVVPGEIAIIAAEDVYRLNIEGDMSRQIDSPQRGVTTPAPAVTPAASVSPTTPSKTPASPVLARAVAPGLSGNTASVSANARVQPAVINVAVGSSSADLDTLTNGLVSGEIGAASDRIIAVVGSAETEENTAAESSAVVSTDQASADQSGVEEAGSEEANSDATESDGSGTDDTGSSTESSDDDAADGDGSDQADSGEGENDGSSDGGGDDTSDDGGLNYGGDQPDGTCSGVPNCASGPNPNSVGGEDDPNEGVEDPVTVGDSGSNDDGNNGNGNDEDRDDDSNPGNGRGNGNGGGNEQDDDGSNNDGPDIDDGGCVVEALGLCVGSASVETDDVDLDDSRGRGDDGDRRRGRGRDRGGDDDDRRGNGNGRGGDDDDDDDRRGNGNGRGNNGDDRGNDGNDSHGGDDDGEDDSNPGGGNGRGNGNGGDNGRGNGRGGGM